MNVDNAQAEGELIDGPGHKSERVEDQESDGYETTVVGEYVLDDSLHQ